MLRAELYQSILTRRFCLSVLGIASVCVLGHAEIIKTAFEYPDFKMFSSLKQIETLLIFDRYKAVMVAVLAGACGCGITSDIRTNRIREIACRITLGQYLRMKLLSILGICVFATCLGFLFAVVILRPVIPFRIPAGSTAAAGAFEGIAKGNMAFLYLFLIGANFALSASIPIIAGIILSLYFPSIYVSAGGAVITFYVFYSFSLFLPPEYCYSDLSSGMHIPYGIGIWEGVVWHLGYWAVLIGCIWGILCTIIKRRYKNGNLV